MNSKVLLAIGIITLIASFFATTQIKQDLAGVVSVIFLGLGLAVLTKPEGKKED